jgi:manganese transport protein
VLSFGIPFALVPLWLLTRREEVMGAFVNSRTSSFFLGLVTTLIILLNSYLLYDLLL